MGPPKGCKTFSVARAFLKTGEDAPPAVAPGQTACLCADWTNPAYQRNAGAAIG